MRTYPHTPGPWICVGGAVYRGDGTELPEVAPIAYMCRDERATMAGIPPTERDSNAQLISASPTLLEACEELIAEFERAADLELERVMGPGVLPTDYDDTPGIALARIAVAKARKDS